MKKIKLLFIFILITLLFLLIKNHKKIEYFYDVNFGRGGPDLNSNRNQHATYPRTIYLQFFYKDGCPSSQKFLYGCCKPILRDNLTITSNNNTDYILSNETDLIIENEFKEIENTNNKYDNVEGEVPAPSGTYSGQNDTLRRSNSIELENINKYSTDEQKNIYKNKVCLDHNNNRLEYCSLPKPLSNLLKDDRNDNKLLIKSQRYNENNSCLAPNDFLYFENNRLLNNSKDHHKCILDTNETELKRPLYYYLRVFVDMINNDYDLLFNEWESNYTNQTKFFSDTTITPEMYEGIPTTAYGKNRLYFHIHLEVLNADTSSENIKSAPLLRLKVPNELSSDENSVLKYKYREYVGDLDDFCSIKDFLGNNLEIEIDSSFIKHRINSDLSFELSTDREIESLSPTPSSSPGINTDTNKNFIKARYNTGDNSFYKDSIERIYTRTNKSTNKAKDFLSQLFIDTSGQNSYNDNIYAEENIQINNKELKSFFCRTLTLYPVNKNIKTRDLDMEARSSQGKNYLTTRPSIEWKYLKNTKLSGEDDTIGSKLREGDSVKYSYMIVMYDKFLKEKHYESDGDFKMIYWVMWNIPGNVTKLPERQYDSITEQRDKNNNLIFTELYPYKIFDMTEEMEKDYHNRKTQRIVRTSHSIKQFINENNIKNPHKFSEKLFTKSVRDIDMGIDFLILTKEQKKGINIIYEKYKNNLEKFYYYLINFIGYNENASTTGLSQDEINNYGYFYKQLKKDFYAELENIAFMTENTIYYRSDLDNSDNSITPSPSVSVQEVLPEFICKSIYPFKEKRLFVNVDDENEGDKLDNLVFKIKYKDNIQNYQKFKENTEANFKKFENTKIVKYQKLVAYNSACKTHQLEIITDNFQEIYFGKEALWTLFFKYEPNINNNILYLKIDDMFFSLSPENKNCHFNIPYITNKVHIGIKQEISNIKLNVTYQENTNSTGILDFNSILLDNSNNELDNKYISKIQVNKSNSNIYRMKLGLQEEGNYLFNFGIKVGKMDGFIRINRETIYNQKLVGARNDIVRPIYYYVENIKNFNFDMKFKESDSNKVDIYHGTITKVDNGMTKNLLNIQNQDSVEGFVLLKDQEGLYRRKGNYLVILRYVYKTGDNINIKINGETYELKLEGNNNTDTYVESINIYLDDIEYIRYIVDNSANKISDIYLSIVPLNFTLPNKMSRIRSITNNIGINKGYFDKIPHIKWNVLERNRDDSYSDITSNNDYLYGVEIFNASKEDDVYYLEWDIRGNEISNKMFRNELIKGNTISYNSGNLNSNGGLIPFKNLGEDGKYNSGSNEIYEYESGLNGELVTMADGKKYVSINDKNCFRDESYRINESSSNDNEYSLPQTIEIGENEFENKDLGNETGILGEYVIDSDYYNYYKASTNSSSGYIIKYNPVIKRWQIWKIMDDTNQNTRNNRNNWIWMANQMEESNLAQDADEFRFFQFTPRIRNILFDFNDYPTPYSMNILVSEVDDKISKKMLLIKLPDNSNLKSDVLNCNPNINAELRDYSESQSPAPAPASLIENNSKISESDAEGITNLYGNHFKNTLFGIINKIDLTDGENLRSINSNFETGEMVYKLRIKAKVSAYRKKSKLSKKLITHRHAHTHNPNLHDRYMDSGLEVSDFVFPSSTNNHVHEHSHRSPDPSDTSQNTEVREGMGPADSHPHRNYQRFLQGPNADSPMMTLYNEEPKLYENMDISNLLKEDLSKADFESMYAANKLFNSDSTDYKKYSRLLSEMVKRTYINENLIEEINRNIIGNDYQTIVSDDRLDFDSYDTKLKFMKVDDALSQILIHRGDLTKVNPEYVRGIVNGYYGLKELNTPGAQLDGRESSLKIDGRDRFQKVYNNKISSRMVDLYKEYVNNKDFTIDFENYSSYGDLNLNQDETLIEYSIPINFSASSIYGILSHTADDNIDNLPVIFQLKRRVSELTQYTYHIKNILDLNNEKLLETTMGISDLFGNPFLLGSLEQSDNSYKKMSKGKILNLILNIVCITIDIDELKQEYEQDLLRIDRQISGSANTPILKARYETERDNMGQIYCLKLQPKIEDLIKTKNELLKINNQLNLKGLNLFSDTIINNIDTEDITLPPSGTDISSFSCLISVREVTLEKIQDKYKSDYFSNDYSSPYLNRGDFSIPPGGRKFKKIYLDDIKTRDFYDFQEEIFISPTESITNYCNDDRFLAPATETNASIENVRFIVTEVELPDIYYNIDTSNNYNPLKAERLNFMNKVYPFFNRIISDKRDIEILDNRITTILGTNAPSYSESEDMNYRDNLFRMNEISDEIQESINYVTNLYNTLLGQENEVNIRRVREYNLSDRLGFASESESPLYSTEGRSSQQLRDFEADKPNMTLKDITDYYKNQIFNLFDNTFGSDNSNP